MNIRCLLGIHDWKYEATAIRSCGSELEKHYRCTRCGERLYMECDTSLKDVNILSFLDVFMLQKIIQNVIK